MKYWFGFGCGVVATLLAVALFLVYMASLGVMEEHSDFEDGQIMPKRHSERVMSIA